jgi:hypothetical protein
VSLLLLTGNALLTGDVVWWDGAGWSRDAAAAVALSRDEGEARMAEEARLEHINDLALVAAEPHPSGGFRPVHVRERIRAFGPTVRPDLATSGRDWR